MGGSDFSSLETSELRAFQELKKRKDLRIRRIGRFGTVLKPVHPHLGLSAAGLENALCILTSHKTSVLAKPAVKPPAQLVFAFCTLRQ